jgi:very-short-patch-repair endonuclease
MYRKTSGYMSLPYSSELKKRARELRKAGNLSEALFWQQVKRKQFCGLDFDRQKVIGRYIVDFYCASLKLIIEIDGDSHNNKEKYDDERNSFLERFGLRVIHIDDKDIKRNLDGVMIWLNEILFGTQPPRPAGTPPLEGNLIENLSNTEPVASHQPPRPAGTPPLEGNLIEKLSSIEFIASHQPPRPAGTPPLEGNL